MARKNKNAGQPNREVQITRRAVRRERNDAFRQIMSERRNQKIDLAKENGR